MKMQRLVEDLRSQQEARTQPHASIGEDLKELRLGGDQWSIQLESPTMPASFS